MNLCDQRDTAELEQRLERCASCMAAVLPVIAIIDILIIFIFRQEISETALPGFLLISVIPPLTCMLACCWRRDGLRERRILHTARHDARAPFLILRSFGNDSLGVGPDCSLGDQPIVQPHSFVVDIGLLTQTLGMSVAIGPTAGGLGQDQFHVIFSTSNDNWRSVFQFTADSARAIFFIPGITDGTAHELQALLSSEVLLDKTLVFMPPTPEIPRLKLFSVYINPEIVRENWVKSQSFWRDRGLAFPDYDEKGMIYIPNRDFSIRRSWTLVRNYSLLCNVSSFRDIIDALPTNGRPLCDVIELLECRFSAEFRVAIN